MTEKDVALHEAEITVIVIPVKKSRKRLSSLEDLKAGMKFQNVYYTKKLSLIIEEKQVSLEKHRGTKRRKE